MFGARRENGSPAFHHKEMMRHQALGDSARAKAKMSFPGSTAYNQHMDRAKEHDRMRDHHRSKIAIASALPR